MLTFLLIFIAFSLTSITGFVKINFFRFFQSKRCQKSYLPSFTTIKAYIVLQSTPFLHAAHINLITKSERRKKVMKLLIIGESEREGEKNIETRRCWNFYCSSDNILSSFQFYSREKFFFLHSPWKLINTESSLNCNFNIHPQL